MNFARNQRRTASSPSSGRGAIRLGRIAAIGLASMTAAAALPAVASAQPTVSTATYVTASGNPMAATARQTLATLRAAQDDDTPQRWSTYRVLRSQLASQVGAALAVEPSRLAQAWAAADLQHQTALLAAMTQIGVPYRRNTSKEDVGFDCSGLTTYAWGQAGLTLTRQSGAQISAAARRDQRTAMAGDLTYYPGHVMMYLGVDEAMVHSPYTGRSVEVVHTPKSRSGRLRYGDPTG